MLMQKGAREPARQSSTANTEPKPASNFFSNPYGSQSSGNPAQSELGSGRNRISRASGGVSNTAPAIAGARVIPAAPVQPPPAEQPGTNTADVRVEPPRDGPQFYSSGSDPEIVGNVAEVPPQNPSAMNPSAQNPNAMPQSQDLVDPPAYIPYQDPNSQFREPTADPNAQAPVDPAQQQPPANGNY